MKGVEPRWQLPAQKGGGVGSAIRALGLTPCDWPLTPMGLYKPIVVVGLDAYSAAMGPLVSAQGRLSHLGEVGVDLTADEGRAAAGQCAAVLLTLLDTHVGLRHVSAVVSITGHIQASRAFQEHAYVMDGASEIFASLLGDRGIGARSSIGVASLPMNAPIVVKVHVALEGRDA